MSRASNDFLQPVISVIGMCASIVSAGLPLLSSSLVNRFFIDGSLSQPISFLSVFLGVALVWQIVEFHRYVHICLGKPKDRGKGFPEPRVVIGNREIIWSLLVVTAVFALLFLLLGSSTWHDTFKIPLSLVQAAFYLLFFLCLIAIFSFLFAFTKGRYEYEAERADFPQTVFETLEKSRLIQPGIEIYENESLSPGDAKNLGLHEVGVFRRVKLITTPQEKFILELVLSNNGKEVKKVLKKEGLQ